jgi:heme exporter protein D
MKKQLLLGCIFSFPFLIATAQERVGIGTATPQAKLHVAGSQRLDSTLQFDIVPTVDMPPMINMFTGGTQNKDRMVIAHSPDYTNWGLQFQDSLDKFNFLSGGTPVFTTDLGSWRVGIGRSDPATRLDVLGTGSYNLASSEGDFRLGDETYRIKMGVSNVGAAAGDAYIASSHRLYLGAGSTLARTQLMSINSNARIGIGTSSPAARLQVVGDTITTPVIQATVSYVGSSDIRGVTSFSRPADGWGYGVEGTGGFIGGYFSGLSGAYTGTGFGVYGTASGTAGTRIGVYGTASGGTVNNWGGFFPTKTYISELRVGGEAGTPGYAAAVNGKLIATEMKVSSIADWPGGTGTSIRPDGITLTNFIANGNVGIGTSSTPSKLSLDGGNGDAFTILNGGDVRIQDDLGTSSVLMYASVPGVAGANRAVLTIISDFKTFSFNGTGGTVSSDARLKQDIVPLTNSLQKIMQLNGYSYRFKTKATVEQKEIGVLAQEVKKVLPEAVYEDDKGMYAVSYNSLVPLLINAVKEQQAVIDELKQKLDQQQNLVKRLEQLEAIVLKQPTIHASSNSQKRLP